MSPRQSAAVKRLRREIRDGHFSHVDGREEDLTRVLDEHERMEKLLRRIVTAYEMPTSHVDRHVLFINAMNDAREALAPRRRKS